MPRLLHRLADRVRRMSGGRHKYQKFSRSHMHPMAAADLKKFNRRLGRRAAGRNSRTRFL